MKYICTVMHYRLEVCLGTQLLAELQARAKHAQAEPNA